MITEFEFQRGEGTNVELVFVNDDLDFLVTLDEDDLIRMIRVAFDVKWFTLDHLIDTFNREEEREEVRE